MAKRINSTGRSNPHKPANLTPTSHGLSEQAQRLAAQVAAQPNAIPPSNTHVKAHEAGQAFIEQQHLQRQAERKPGK